MVTNHLNTHFLNTDDLQPDSSDGFNSSDFVSVQFRLSFSTVQTLFQYSLDFVSVQFRLVFSRHNIEPLNKNERFQIYIYTATPL